VRLALSRKNLWEQLPRPLKKAVRPLLNQVPPELLLGSGFRQQLRFVRRAEWHSAAELRTYQEHRLREVLSLAYYQTSYYREVFDRAGFHPDHFTRLDDLRRLPVLERETLRTRSTELCTVAATGPKVDRVSTGGTSGKTVQFYIGANRSQIEYAHLVAGWARAGYQLGTPTAVFRGRVVPEERPLFRHDYDPILKHHFYSNFHMTDDNMSRYVAHVRGLGGCFLHVYPSAATALARFIRRSGAGAPTNVRGILAESEILYPADRELIEMVFGCRVFSSYGLSEKVVAAAQCEHSNAYHVWPTYGCLELIDERGRPVTTPGQRGEIVGTGFINTVMPFIRYRTGDFATFLGDRCDQCGRAHMVLGDIRGHRIQEHLVASDGSLISWTALNMHDDTFEHVLRFQFQQDAPGAALLKLVPAPGFSTIDETRIQARLGVKFDNRIQLTMRLVESIELSATGKSIYVDQRIAGLEAGTAPAPTMH
jgi:phenylacetate-CoA ligase